MTREILLVDDDMIQLQLLSMLLESEGFDVTIASNGMNAMEILNGARFRMIITDLNMSGISGIELAVRAKKLFAETDVVLVTGDIFLEEFDEAVEAGITTIFHKPVSLKRLVASIRSSLSKKGLETAPA